MTWNWREGNARGRDEESRYWERNGERIVTLTAGMLFYGERIVTSTSGMLFWKIKFHERKEKGRNEMREELKTIDKNEEKWREIYEKKNMKRKQIKLEES